MANGQQLRRNGSSTPSRARFMVGRDKRGRWIVQDQHGLVGGLFVNEAAALHFAGEECNHNPTDICRAPDGVVLDIATPFEMRLNVH